MKNQKYVILDYETFSECDLKKCGAYEYSVHPSTEIICAAWRVGTREELLKAPVEVWAPYLWDSYPEHAKNAQNAAYNKLLKALMDPEAILVAHNALFEQVISKNVLLRKLMYRGEVAFDKREAALKRLVPEKWLCTAALAASHALPRSLEGAGAALKLPIEKDMDGRRLILKWCKPRKPSKADPSTRHRDLKEYKRLIQYCKTDVIAETHLFLRLPELNPMEKKVWVLDQKINQRGIKVDRPLVKKILGLIKEESDFFTSEIIRITEGEVESAQQQKALLAWINKNSPEDLRLANLQKKTVEDAVNKGAHSAKVLTVLKIRLMASKTSTAKYLALEMRTRSDSYLRDILLYHAASTGRWGGTGFQPQNLPRGSIEDTYFACEMIMKHDLEWLRIMYGSPMELFSSCIRSMLLADKGKLLRVADYAAIEARVLAWVADDEDALKAFLNGDPVYESMASVIYGIMVEAVTKAQRQVGKQAELGCGYGMGATKFYETCIALGINIDMETAERAVKAYRAKHKKIVQCWSNMEKAAIAAVLNPGKRFKINKVIWFVNGEFLYCELPSGRRLAYYGPSIRWKETPWGEKRPTLYHWGTNSMTKKWEESGTYGGKLVENVVQAIARDLMAESMLSIEDAGYEIKMSVHDELVSECSPFHGSQEEFESLMSYVPTWAKGCPVKVEGWGGPRYKK